MRRIATLALALCVALPETLRAQEDFTRLKLKVGHQALVAKDGITLTGAVTAVSPTVLASAITN